MAAQIPIKDNPEANKQAMGKVIADKEREVGLGHDGTWVAHPALVSIAKECFDAKMKTPNQLGVLREEVRVSAKDLLTVPQGEITEQGVRSNVSVGLQYLEAWLKGNGCVPLYNLMEDAATAEISRAQLWQWIRHPKGVLSDGRKVTVELFRGYLKEEKLRIKNELGAGQYEASRFELAAKIFDQITTDSEFIDFLTLAAYKHI